MFSVAVRAGAAGLSTPVWSAAAEVRSAAVAVFSVALGGGAAELSASMWSAAAFFTEASAFLVVVGPGVSESPAAGLWCSANASVVAECGAAGPAAAAWAAEASPPPVDADTGAAESAADASAAPEWFTAEVAAAGLAAPEFAAAEPAAIEPAAPGPAEPGDPAPIPSDRALEGADVIAASTRVPRPLRLAASQGRAPTRGRRFRSRMSLPITFAAIVVFPSPGAVIAGARGTGVPD